MNYIADLFYSGEGLHRTKHTFRFGLVSLFNGISTFMGYLMPKPSLLKYTSDTF